MISWNGGGKRGSSGAPKMDKERKLKHLTEKVGTALLRGGAVTRRARTTTYLRSATATLKSLISLEEACFFEDSYKEIIIRHHKGKYTDYSRGVGHLKPRDSKQNPCKNTKRHIPYIVEGFLS